MTRAVSKISACVAATILALAAWPGAGIAQAQKAPKVEQDALASLSRVAPAVAQAIRNDPALQAEIGAEKLPEALRQLSRFAASQDPDCQEALRIIGDTVLRPPYGGWVGAVSLDGAPTEWDVAIPPADFARPTTGRSHEVWVRGAAAVVHDGCLYVMAGLDPAFWAKGENELRIKLDCSDGSEWDAVLLLTRRGDRWTGAWGNASDPQAPAKPLSGVRAAISAVAELAVHTGDFVPPEKAKPIWTLHLEAHQKTGGSDSWIGTKYLPVLNDTARPGAAAGPYVAAFLHLCADARLEESDRTAAAIAIMSATVYQGGDADVRQQIRRDNAEFLQFARDLNVWQEKQQTQYRLKDYPLEAQLAWAHRCLRNRRFFVLQKDPKRPFNDAENYYWASTSVETLRKLQALAVREGLVSPSVYDTAMNMDRWVRKKQTYSLSPKWYRRQMKAAEGNAEELAKLKGKLEEAEQRERTADVVGQFHGKPVSAFRLYHTEELLEQIEERGRTMGTCGNHTSFCADLMRAVGIAAISFVVEPSRSDKIDHVWPAHYDPSQQVWRSYQAGRKDSEWWYFSVSRIPVYTYAAAAPHLSLTKSYQGPRPFPFLISNELQGFEVKEQAQKGMDARIIREWMLTPSF